MPAYILVFLQKSPTATIYDMTYQRGFVLSLRKRPGYAKTGFPKFGTICITDRENADLQNLIEEWDDNGTMKRRRYVISEAACQLLEANNGYVEVQMNNISASIVDRSGA